jgi:hypothetical protein
MIEAAGEWRVLGCLPPSLALGAPAVWGADRTLPRDKWRECDYQAAWPQVATDDQGRTETCVGHAVETVFSYAWLQAGQKWKVFSPTYIYGLINHGVDRGSSLSDAMNALKLFGICEAGYVPEGMIFRSQFPAAAFANGRRHKPVECLSVRSYDQVCSSLSLGFPLATGILVGTDFSKLDDEGVCPVPTKAAGGHAVALVGLKFSKKWNDWLVLVQNSYGESWGFRGAGGRGGFAYLRRAHFDKCFFDTWAVGGVMSDPEDLGDDLPVAN